MPETPIHLDPFADYDTGFIAIAALRYTIGRRTYAPGLVTDWLKRYWGRLDEATRKTILRDVEQEIQQHERHLPGGDLHDASEALQDYSRGRLGDECDRRAWYAFRDWIVEQDAVAQEELR